MKSRFSLALLSIAALSAVACGAENDEGSGTGAEQEAVDECGLNTGFEGDEYCIKPPAPGEGIQIHFGPSSYDDPDALKDYVIDPGEENVVCYNAPISESDIYYDRQSNRMRPHSHHMRIFISSDMNAQAGPTSSCLSAGFGSSGMIRGSQSPSWDSEVSTAPEDQGFARYVPEATMANFEIHYINETTEPLLREGWVNLYTVPQDRVTQYLNMIMMVGDFTIDIPENTEKDTPVTYAPPITSTTRLYDVTAHMHAHAEQYDLYRQHAGQADWESIYTVFDWEEPLTAVFNTTVKNPAPNTATKTEGALSGIISLEPGDTLKWVCHVNNTSSSPFGVISPSIGFANEAKTAEMCMLTGDFVSSSPGIWNSFCFGGRCL